MVIGSASIGGGERRSSGGRGLKGPLEYLKAFGFGDQIYKTRERSESHLRDGEAEEIGAEAAEELVDFVGVINGSSDVMKLVRQGLEGMGVVCNWFGAAFHQQ